MDAKKANLPLILPLIILLATQALAEVNSVYIMDGSGNADMTVTEAIDMELAGGGLMASLDKKGILSFKGSLSYAEAVNDPDYRMSLEADGSRARVSFDATGGMVSDFLDDSGDFQVDMTVKEGDDTIEIGVIAVVQKAFVEDVLMLDTESLEESPAEFGQDLEDSLNEVFDSPMMPAKLDATVKNFTISGDSELTIGFDVSVSGWGGFMAAVAAQNYQQSADSTKLLDCLGVRPEELITSLLGRRTNTDLELTGSTDDGKISGTMTSDSAQSALSSSNIEELSLDLSKSGTSMSLDGSGVITSPGTLMGCVMSNYVPMGNLQNIDYRLEPGDGGAVQTLEGRIVGLAKGSGDSFSVTFPVESTNGSNITVTVPQDMGITSVSGGDSHGNSATSSGVGEFRVTYSKAPSAMDINLIIAVAVVLILLLLLLRRRK